MVDGVVDGRWYGWWMAQTVWESNQECVLIPKYKAYTQDC